MITKKIILQVTAIAKFPPEESPPIATRVGSTFNDSLLSRLITQDKTS